MSQLNPSRALLYLSCLGLAAAALLAGVDRITRDRIQQANNARAEATLAAMLPQLSFNNDLLSDVIEINLPALEQPAQVYRARQNGQPVAAVFDLVTPRGYSGDIRLMVSINTDAEIVQTRVLSHRETPGLGDKIEVERDDWIRQFSGLSLERRPSAGWAPDRRGGDFDTLTSATITSAAVIEAVHAALQGFVQTDPDELWKPAPAS
jgi:electron transport complex protein RnfG